MFLYKTIDKTETVEIHNRSYRAICPDCGNITTFIADGEITLYDTSDYSDLSGRNKTDLCDLNIGLQINMLCRSCSDKNGNKDNCIVENFAIFRLKDALQRLLDKFDICGISASNLCELSDRPTIIDGIQVNTYRMPFVKYLLPKSKQQMINPILLAFLTNMQMRVGINVVLSVEIGDEDNCSYYSMKFYINESIVSVLYDPDFDVDYRKFVDNIFIEKIDMLAQLVESSTH